MTKKNKTTQKIRAASVAIIVEIGRDGKKSVRKLAQLIKGAKSSVHRHLRAQMRRNRHPESAFWETEAGSAWLRLLVFAAIYQFGLPARIYAPVVVIKNILYCLPQLNRDHCITGNNDY